jgi:ribosomal protein L37AE/L43A
MSEDSAPEQFTKLQDILDMVTNQSYPPPSTCEFCDQPGINRLRMLDWVVCENCAEKIKKRLKLILDFQ